MPHPVFMYCILTVAAITLSLVVTDIAQSLPFVLLFQNNISLRTKCLRPENVSRPLGSSLGCFSALATGWLSQLEIHCKSPMSVSGILHFIIYINDISFQKTFQHIPKHGVFHLFAEPIIFFNCQRLFVEVLRHVGNEFILHPIIPLTFPSKQVSIDVIKICIINMSNNTTMSRNIKICEKHC